MRIRTIKPEFFRHEALHSLEMSTGLPLRVAYAGLWCAADREGRFRWRPAHLKLDILPWDTCDFAAVLEALERGGFVVRYEVDGQQYGCLPTFLEHQKPNSRESASRIPPPHDDARARTCMHAQDHGEGKGKGREREVEGKGRDSACSRGPAPGFVEIESLGCWNPVNDVVAASRAYAKLAESDSLIQVIDGAKRYAAYVEAEGTPPDRRMGLVRFLRNDLWRRQWTSERRSGLSSKESRNVDAAKRALERLEAQQ